jgi:hypothetical protein
MDVARFDLAADSVLLQPFAAGRIYPTTGLG